MINVIIFIGCALIILFLTASYFKHKKNEKGGSENGIPPNDRYPIW